MRAKYCELFSTFFKIGTFTIGGGYAMIPLIQREVVDRRHWLSASEMLDAIALSQTMPGILAANIAAIVGQKLRGVRGALVAVMANTLMPIVFIILIAALFRQFKDIPAVQHIFMGIRPAVVALIAAPVFTLWKAASSRQSAVSKLPLTVTIFNRQFSLLNILIPVISAILIWLLGFSPILVVLAAILLGWLYGLKTRKDLPSARNH